LWTRSAQPGTTLRSFIAIRKTPLPDGVEGMIGDRNDGASIRSADRGRTFDAVFDNVYDWERHTTAEQVEGTARACAGNALQRYVFMSSVAAYEEGLDRVEYDLWRAGPSEYVRVPTRRKVNARYSVCISGKDSRWSLFVRRSYTVRTIRFTARLSSGIGSATTGPSSFRVTATA
jgi:hypothetical protein